MRDNHLDIVSDIVNWYREAHKDPSSLVLPHPEKGRWKQYDDSRLWCDLFFTVAAKGSSKAARDYLEPIEDGFLGFELKVADLKPLNFNERMKLIWEFGRGKNRLGKALGRFFSTPQKYGRNNSYERVCTDFFCAFEQRGFTKWLHEIDKLSSERDKAKELELVHGINLKASRDFLNAIGMTETLIALDVQVLQEMKNNWGWNVPPQTPSNRELYEKIEDGVRDIAKRIGATVLEIDKAIYFGRTTGEYYNP